MNRQDRFDPKSPAAPRPKPLQARFTSFPIVRRVRPASDVGQLLDRSAKVAILGIFLAVVIHSLSAWSAFLVPVVAAIIMGLMLGPPMTLLERVGLPSALAALVVLASLAGGLYLMILTLSPAFVEWFTRLPEIWQEVERHINEMRWHLRTVEQVRETLAQAAGDGEGERVAVEGPGFLSAILTIAPPALGQVVLFFGALFFYLATRHGIRTGLLSLCIGRSAKLRAARILRDVEVNISSYLLTITVINAGLGLATGVVMWLIGVPSPALWGALAAILNFVLYIGPWFFAILLGAVGLVTFDTLGAAILPMAAFVTLNFVESQFVTPAILGRRLTLNPFMIILALGFWMWLWGPVGAFLALPLLIVSVIVLAHILPAGVRPAIARPGRPAAGEAAAPPPAR